MSNNKLDNIIKNIPIAILKSQKAFSKIIVTGEAGAGLVQVKLDGKKNILDLKIDNMLMQEEKLIIENLISSAINKANKKVDAEVNVKLTSIVSEMGIPSNIASILPFINFDSN